MADSEQLRACWTSFRDAHADELPAEPYETERFGDSDAMADELGALIVAGTKTATCSALWEYEAEGDPLPFVGQRAIVLDGRGTPLCIREITEVEIRAFRDVDARFAHDEGEGDRTLEHWRRAHWDFFARNLLEIGLAPTDDMPLVCERFTVIHRWGDATE